MNKSSRLNHPDLSRILVFALIFTLGFMLTSSFSLQAEEGAFPGEKAPDFTLTEPDSQEEVSLNQYADDMVLLNFWTTWCPVCGEEMPDLQQIEDEYEDEAIVLTVNIGESASEISSYMEEGGYDFTVLMDDDQETAGLYMVRGVPTTFILDDENNTILERHVGPMSYEQKLELLELN